MYNHRIHRELSNEKAGNFKTLFALRILLVAKNRIFYLSYENSKITGESLFHIQLDYLTALKTILLFLTVSICPIPKRQGLLLSGQQRR
jgi:hypothetical protein